MSKLSKRDSRIIEKAKQEGFSLGFERAVRVISCMSKEEFKTLIRSMDHEHTRQKNRREP